MHSMKHKMNMKMILMNLVFKELSSMPLEIVNMREMLNGEIRTTRPFERTTRQMIHNGEGIYELNKILKICQNLFDMMMMNEVYPILLNLLCNKTQKPLIY